MNDDPRRFARPRERRRHDLEMLAIPLGILLVMAVLAWLDTLQPRIF